MQKPIDFDHAATTPLCQEALDAMLPYFTEVFGNPNSQHYFGREAVKAVDKVEDKLINLYNASKETFDKVMVSIRQKAEIKKSEEKK